MSRGTICSKCGEEPARPGQRWGKRCHAAHMRATRKSHSELSDEARRRANARSYLSEYVRRGKVVKPSRCLCGSPDQIEAHHVDYSKPLLVIWLCRECHLRIHHGSSLRSSG